MKRKYNKHWDNAVLIDYRPLGTIAIDELKQALWEDIAILKDRGVSYVTNARLTVPITNEYGDPRWLRDGGARRMPTQHYRPACKDYDL